MTKYTQELDALIQQTNEKYNEIRCTYNEALTIKEQVPELETNVLAIENKRLTNLYSIMSALDTDKALHQYKTKLDSIVLNYNTQLQAQQTDFQKKETRFLHDISVLESVNQQLQSQIDSLTLRMATHSDEKHQLTEQLRIQEREFEQQLHAKQLDVDAATYKARTLETTLEEHTQQFQANERRQRELFANQTTEHQKACARYESMLVCARQEYDRERSELISERDGLVQEKNRLQFEHEKNVSELTTSLQNAQKTIDTMTEKIQKLQKIKRSNK